MFRHFDEFCWVSKAWFKHLDAGEFCCCPGELAHENGGSEFTWEQDHEARAKLWKARHEIMYASLALKPGKKVGVAT